MENNELPSWMSDASVRDIPKKKLLFLNTVFHSSALQGQKNLLLLLPSLMQRAKKENLLFTQDELSRSIQAIRRHCTEEELKRVDQILKMGKENPAE